MRPTAIPSAREVPMSKYTDLESALSAAGDGLPELDDDAVMLLPEDAEPFAWDDETTPGTSPAEPEVTMPPERVRFCAPVRIETEAGDRVVDGTVVNLSVRGI